MNRFIAASILSIVFAPLALAFPGHQALPANGEYTIEWTRSIDDVKHARPFATLDGTTVGLRQIPKQMVQTPPRLVLAAGDNVRTKLFVYPGKRFHVALVAKDGSGQFYLNGYPDGDPFPLAKAKDCTPFDDVAGLDFTETDHALAQDEILAHVKALGPHKPVTVCGHRGDNTGCPENTNISYVTAIGMKAPVVEMDLRLTKDNTLILLHDATVDRTTTSKGKIADMTLEQSRALDAGSKKDAKYKSEPLPMMQTIIDTCRDKTIMMLDLKLEDLAQPLADIKAKNNLPDDFWILAPWSDEHGIKLHKVMPHVPMIRLTGKVPTTQPNDAYFKHMKEIGFTGFSIAYPITPASFIESAHKAGMNVWVWTVNEPSDIAGSVLLGADGIITDNIPSTTKVVDELTK